MSPDISARLLSLILFFRAAPRLKDAELLESQIQLLYIEMLSMMRTIFKKCRLVHADLSEYNILLVHKYPSAFTC